MSMYATQFNVSYLILLCITWPGPVADGGHGGAPGGGMDRARPSDGRPSGGHYYGGHPFDQRTRREFENLVTLEEHASQAHYIRRA